MTDRAHRLIYKEVPQTQPCKKACGACCGPVPWSDKELTRVRVPPDSEWITLRHGTRALMNPTTGMCPFLTDERGCAVYDQRPFMCRIFAASADPVLVCPHGAQAHRPLSATKTDELTSRYVALHQETSP